MEDLIVAGAVDARIEAEFAHPELKRRHDGFDRERSCDTHVPNRRARERSCVVVGRGKRRGGATQIRQFAGFHGGRERKSVNERGKTLTDRVHTRFIEMIRMVGEFEERISAGIALGHVDGQRHWLPSSKDDRSDLRPRQVEIVVALFGGDKGHEHVERRSTSVPREVQRPSSAHPPEAADAYSRDQVVW